MGTDISYTLHEVKREYVESQICEQERQIGQRGEGDEKVHVSRLVYVRSAAALGQTTPPL